MKRIFAFAVLACAACEEIYDPELSVESSPSAPIGVEEPDGSSPESCAAPCPDLGDCARSQLVDGGCEVTYATPGTPCGFAGACDGSGHCEGLLAPLPCPEDPCPGSDECGAAYCDPYTGQCKVHRFDNGTSCGGGLGHCNVTSGTCCLGALVIVCELPDPTLCWPTCSTNVNAPGCWLACGDGCPIGMSELPGRGLCWPTANTAF